MLCGSDVVLIAIICYDAATEGRKTAADAGDEAEECAAETLYPQEGTQVTYITFCLEKPSISVKVSKITVHFLGNQTIKPLLDTYFDHLTFSQVEIFNDFFVKFPQISANIT